MARRKRSATPADVKKVRRSIERWRKTREKRTHMPEELWRAAVTLAQKHGVYATARAREIGYGTLKERVSGSQKMRSDGTARSAGFIELDGTQLVGSLGPHGPVVELSGADGAKLMIRLRESEDQDILGLAAAFWSRGA